MLAHAREGGRDPLILVLEHLQDPTNFGTLLRSAEAAGVRRRRLSRARGGAAERRGGQGQRRRQRAPPHRPAADHRRSHPRAQVRGPPPGGSRTGRARIGVDERADRAAGDRRGKRGERAVRCHPPPVRPARQLPDGRPRGESERIHGWRAPALRGCAPAGGLNRNSGTPYACLGAHDATDRSSSSVSSPPAPGRPDDGQRGRRALPAAEARGEHPPPGPGSATPAPPGQPPQSLIPWPSRRGWRLSDARVPVVVNWAGGGARHSEVNRCRSTCRASATRPRHGRVW